MEFMEANIAQAMVKIFLLGFFGGSKSARDFWPEMVFSIGFQSVSISFSDRDREEKEV